MSNIEQTKLLQLKHVQFVYLHVCAFHLQRFNYVSCD